MDCSDDLCKHLNEAQSCTKDALTTEGNSPMAHKFTDKDGNSGSAYTIMAWVKCANAGG